MMAAQHRRASLISRGAGYGDAMREAGQLEQRIRVASADQLETTLLKMLDLVNDWLKFAEAKNGGVVGLASGAIALLLSYVQDVTTDDVSLPFAAGLIIGFSGVCLIGSVLVGVASFFPRTNLSRVLVGKLGEPEGTDNLYFFGHIAKYGERHLAEAVRRRYLDQKGAPVNENHQAIAAQAVINARITLQKLRLFGIAAILFGVGVTAAVLGIGLAAVL